MAGLRYLSTADEALAHDYYWVDEFRNEIVPVSVYRNLDFRGLAQLHVSDDWRRVPKAYTALKQVRPDTTPVGPQQTKFREVDTHEDSPWKHDTHATITDFSRWLDTTGTERHVDQHRFRDIFGEDGDDWKRVNAGQSAMAGLGVDTTRAGQSVHEHDHRGLEHMDDDWKRVNAGQSAMAGLGVDTTRAGQSVHEHDHRGLEHMDDDWKRVNAGQSAMAGLGVDTTRAGQSVHEHDHGGLEHMDDDWKRVNAGQSAMAGLGVDTTRAGQSVHEHDHRGLEHMDDDWKRVNAGQSAMAGLGVDTTRAGQSAVDASDDWKRVNAGQSAMAGLGVDTTRAGQSAHHHDHRGLEAVDASDDWKRVNAGQSAMAGLDYDTVPIAGAFAAGSVTHNDTLWLDAIPLLHDTPFEFRPASQPFHAGTYNATHVPPLDTTPYGAPALHRFRDEADAVWRPALNAHDAIKPLDIDTTLTPDEVVFRELERIGFKDNWNPSTRVVRSASPRVLEPLPQHPSTIEYRPEEPAAAAGADRRPRFSVGRVPSPPPAVDTRPLLRHASTHSFRDVSTPDSRRGSTTPVRSASAMAGTAPPPHTPSPSLHASFAERDFFWDYAGANFGKSLKSARSRPLSRQPSNVGFAPMTEEPLFEVLQRFQFRDDATPQRQRQRQQQRERWNTSTRVPEPQYNTSIMSDQAESPRPSRRASLDMRVREQQEHQHQHRRRQWRYSLRTDDLFSRSIEPLDPLPSEVQPDQVFFEQLRRSSMSTPTKRPRALRKTASDVQLRPFSPRSRRATIAVQAPISEMPETDDDHTLAGAGDMPRRPEDRERPRTSTTHGTRGGGGGARTPMWRTPVLANTWEHDAQESLERVIADRRRARMQRREELERRRQRRRELQGDVHTSGDDGIVGANGHRDGDGDGDGDGGASRSLGRQAKPKLTANALERLAKLRDLMERQQF
ncbi:hypothetical protein PTSG_07104 [Salpingoeca rosetta]|uniref:Uncharacterized protein n=1 Tax=Salpingoeca rosetta (strain ATCC 50818 / BSB-021) TaxID=946362 RepID=F2UE26_SALR5|nr:uncharacterized protein PTSG_07104 [Salpingoeca rosetta]EGD74876.1 hypothetical protein PTSG_07104 [Salpingoeca rosetta]|eukprot:XP_004992521.1 hypothetical protein PTSG_07104 [Salpingoeca rosetta]